MNGSPLLDRRPTAGPAPATAVAARSAPRAGFESALAGGFAFGAVLYGLVLSVVHVAYNQLASSRDALITLAAFLTLYGLWATAAFGLGWAVARGLARLRRQPAGAAGGEETLRRGALWGVLLFDVFFWELFWLYGLTYDQVPFGRPAGPGGMLGWVAALVVAIAVAAGLASWIVFRPFWAIWRRGRLWHLAAVLLAAGVLVHAAAPLWAGREPPARAKTAASAGPAAAPSLVVAETGVDVALVGLDGADWQVIRPLMEQGELPAFARLVSDGASGPLATIHDSNSAVIWASMYTGKEPREHGVLDFYRIRFPGMASNGVFPVHRTYFKELADRLAALGLARQSMVSRRSLHALPIWEIADAAGLPVGVVDGYFYSVPALEPSRPESFFLSYGLDAFEQLPGGKSLKEVSLFVQPTALYREVRPLLDRGDFHWQSAALLQVLASRPQPRFLNFYTHEPDTAQHWYWKWYQPELFLGVTPEGLAEHAGKIPDLHRDFDAFLGRLGAALDPETVIVVASDHGHAPTILHNDYYTQHRHGPPGILVMAGGPIRRGVALEGADVYDLVPTLLYLLGLPVPEDAVGAVLLDAIDPEFVRRHPVRTIPSYEGLWPEREIRTGPDRGLNEQEIEKLRSLGYL